MILFERRASVILFNIIMHTDLSKKMLIPANVCPIVLATLLKAKKSFEIVDIDPKLFHIDTNIVVDNIIASKSTYDSILFVRTYGANIDYEEFFSMVKSLNDEILIIDDRCLTKPSFDRDLSTNVDVTLYSTGYAKYVELGYGGYALVNKDFSYKKITLPFAAEDHEILTNHFRKVIAGDKEFAYQDGDWLDINLPIVELYEYIQSVLKSLDVVNSHKNRINNIYLENLPSEIVMGIDFNTWRFNILVNNKEYILKKLFDEGLFASSHYAPLSLFYNNQNFKVAEHLHSKIINLFNDYRITEETAYKISKIIRENT